MPVCPSFFLIVLVRSSSVLNPASLYVRLLFVVFRRSFVQKFVLQSSFLVRSSSFVRSADVMCLRIIRAS